MKIATGEHTGLTVPTSALLWREGKAQVWRTSLSSATGHAKKQYTCTMHPEVIEDRPGKCPKCGMELVPKELDGKSEANLADVEVGLSNADRTEILSGLSEGAGVVYAGYGNLKPGVAVVAAAWGKAGPLKLPTASEVQSNRLDSGNNWKHEEMTGDLMLKVALDPAKGDGNSVLVRLSKQGGAAVEGVPVALKTSMPGMGDMAGPDLHGNTDSSGEARLKSNLSSGLWRLHLTVSPASSAPIVKTLDVEVP